MEINPYETRLRVLQMQDGVQMQREATPGTDTAGCPGCPYYWTCDVPHTAEDVHAPAEYDRDEVADQVPAREDYRPRDADDIGWTDQWVEVDEDDPVDDEVGTEGDSGIFEPEDDPDTDSDADAGSAGADAPPSALERRRARRAAADAEAALARRPRRGWKDLLRPRRG